MNLRRALLAALVLLTVGLAGCSSTDDSAVKTPTTDKADPAPQRSDLSADDAEYAAAIEKGLSSSDSRPDGVSDEDITCFANKAAQAVGADSFTQAGIKPEDMDDPSAFEQLQDTITDDQTQALAGAFFDCLDFGAIMAGQMSGAQEGIDPQCLGDAMTESAEFRQAFGRTITGKTDDLQLTDDEASAVAPEIMDCLDFGKVIAAQLADTSDGIDTECLGNAVGESESFTQALARRLVDSNAEIELTDAEAQSMADEAVSCIDVAALLRGEGRDLTDAQAQCVEDGVAALDENPFVAVLAEAFRSGGDPSALGSTLGGKVLAPIVADCVK